MSSIASPEQCAFLSDRYIHNNSIVTHEIFHFLRGKTRRKRKVCALKIDMAKAYDKVEWSFLKHVRL